MFSDRPQFSLDCYSNDDSSDCNVDIHSNDYSNDNIYDYIDSDTNQ